MNIGSTKDKKKRPVTKPPRGAKRGRPALGSQAANASLSPAMQQYIEQKAQVGDALLLFRMGDFYETFYEDAKTLARVLGLTLTSRNKNSKDPIPLAGMPYHAVDGYIAKLVRAGYKVAISEQIEDPKLAKGVVKRAIQRVITPGTLTEEGLLDEQRPNYLIALCPEGDDWNKGRIGLACVEVSSGRFFAEMIQAEGIGDDLARMDAAEILIPDAGIDAKETFAALCGESAGDAAISPRPLHVFDPHTARAALCRHFDVAGLEGFGFETFDASLCAAAAVLDYLHETQKSTLRHIQTITRRRLDQYVMIDQTALRSLEILRTMRDGSREGSLFHAVDMTACPMGARRLADWLCYPLCNAAEIIARQNAITDLINQPDRLRRVREILREMGDMERIAARLGVGRASPRDLVVLAAALLRCKAFIKEIGPSVHSSVGEKPPERQDASDLLTRLMHPLEGMEALAGFLTKALKEDAPAILRDGGFIADGYDEELDRLREIGTTGRAWLAQYQAQEAHRTGISSLKVGYNSVFGYYIEITHLHREKVPPEYVRKQTLTSGERYITEELKQHENEVLGAADRAKQLEMELFAEIRKRTSDELPRLIAAADAVATLDVLAGFAELARCRDYCRPELVAGDDRDDSGGNVLHITDGRHPVLDVTMAERFVPNDCQLSAGGDRLLIITGPNMAGKSTYIRQVALLVLLAQTGSYVPARSMRWSPVDRLFARVGAGDELARGLSTFMVEMVETARILHNATAQSLVILDEIGRGTSTYDGLSLAWATAEHLIEQVGCRALFATHYHELTELSERFGGIANYNVAVREQLRPDKTGRDIVFLHKIVPGASDRSYGIHVAAMAGMPQSVLKRSEFILEGLERGFRRKSPKSGAPDSDTSSSGQLLLFEKSEAMPEWWRDLVDALGQVNINETTPLEAHTLLQQLKSILENEHSGDG